MKTALSAKSLLFWGLACLNVFLLVVVVNRYSKPNAAMAQGLAPGDYLTAPGTITGQSDGVVFVLDTRNGLMPAMQYDSGKQTFGSLPSIDVNRALQAGAGAVPGGVVPRRGK